MTALTADERLANAIWRVVHKPSQIYSKSQIRTALAADGIYRSMTTLFGSTSIRRLLESKAAAKGLALVIDKGCVFVTTEEYEILHKQVRILRYLSTLAESVGHAGRGNDILMAAHDPVSQSMGQRAVAAGIFGADLRAALTVADAALATTFEAGRRAADAQFAARRARAIARRP
jgi:hypothetical protein